MWQEALDDAEEIIEDDNTNVQAIFCRAESLFNLCQFENSLCAFYRGQVFTYLHMMHRVSFKCSNVHGYGYSLFIQHGI